MGRGRAPREMAGRAVPARYVGGAGLGGSGETTSESHHRRFGWRSLALSRACIRWRDACQRQYARPKGDLDAAARFSAARSRARSSFSASRVTRPAPYPRERGRYAARGTARARLRAQASLARIVRSACSRTRSRPRQACSRCDRPMGMGDVRRLGVGLGQVAKTTPGSSSSTGAMTTRPRRSSFPSARYGGDAADVRVTETGHAGDAMRSPLAPLTPPAASPSWFAHSRRYLSTTSSSPSSSLRIPRVFSSEVPRRPPLRGPALHAWCRPSRAGS